MEYELSDSLISTLRGIVLVLDTDGRIHTVNPYFEELTGYTTDEIVGRDWFDTFIPPGERETIRNLFSAVLLEKIQDGYTNEIVNKDGERIVIEWHSTTLNDSEGAVAGMLCTGHDVTERVSIASELEAAKTEAERANTGKSRFLAAASHDLRQPLQSIGLYLSVLDKHLKSDDLREISRKMRSSLDVVSELLDALLDISKLESGSVKAEMEDFPVRPLLDRVVCDNIQQAEAKGLQLSSTAPDCILHSDSKLLERIIENFVTNAIRYTEQGEVRIVCTSTDDTAQISVIDTGIGVAEEEVGNIFEEYYQLDNPMRDHRNGLGLGLSIVRHIARLLDHPLRVESAQGMGSTFSVEVPLGNPMTTPAIRSSRSIPKIRAGRGSVVLFIDDDPAIVDSMKMLLSAEGITVHAALNGDEAQQHIAAGVRPDLLVSDFRLPGYNGVELVRRIKSVTAEDLPTVIMTGDTSSHEIEAAGLSNCRVLHKPVDVDHLISIIQTTVT